MPWSFLQSVRELSRIAKSDFPGHSKERENLPFVLGEDPAKTAGGAGPNAKNFEIVTEETKQMLKKFEPQLRVIISALR